MLKLLVSSETRKLLGVHLFGTGATESVHIGQAVMGCGGDVDYLVQAVFNYLDPRRGVQGRRARRVEQASRRAKPAGVRPDPRTRVSASLP
jgi:hypothetical protein